MALVSWNRKRSLTNPARKSGTKRRAPKAQVRARKAKRNVGEIVALTLANPNRGNKNVARTKKKSAGRGRSHRRSHSRPARRRNPAAFKMNTHRRRRRNGKSTGSMVGLFEQGAFAIGGAAGSKYLAQMILGSSNSGIMGYAANLAIGFVLGKGVGMFTKNTAFENATILGAVIATMTRALLDNTSVGSTLGLSGVGDYVAQATIIPPTLVPGTRFTYNNPWAAQTQGMINSAVAALPAPSTAKLGAYGRIGRSTIAGR